MLIWYYIEQRTLKLYEHRNYHLHYRMWWFFMMSCCQNASTFSTKLSKIQLTEEMTLICISIYLFLLLCSQTLMSSATSIRPRSNIWAPHVAGWTRARHQNSSGGHFMQGWDCWINSFVTHFLTYWLLMGALSACSEDMGTALQLSHHGRIRLTGLVISVLKSAKNQNCFTAFTSLMFYACLAQASLMLA